MVNLATSEEWQRQSSLLLQARPTTTRITTKYKVPNLDSPKYQKPKKRKRGADAETEGKESETAPKVPKAVLSLKTFDPESGVVLKFKTDRAADVGRLIGSLGRMGRHMAALPQKTEDVVMEEAPAAEQEAAPKPATAANATQGGAADGKPQQGGGGGGKKKKKGKK